MRYLVISYDDDQQQTFFDIVEAEDHDAAMDIVGQVREYAIPTEALNSVNIRGLLELVIKPDLSDVITKDNLGEYKERYS